MADKFKVVDVDPPDKDTPEVPTAQLEMELNKHDDYQLVYLFRLQHGRYRLVLMEREGP